MLVDGRGWNGHGGSRASAWQWALGMEVDNHRNGRRVEAEGRHRSSIAYPPHQHPILTRSPYSHPLLANSTYHQYLRDGNQRTLSTVTLITKCISRNHSREMNTQARANAMHQPPVYHPLYPPSPLPRSCPLTPSPHALFPFLPFLPTPFPPSAARKSLPHKMLNLHHPLPCPRFPLPSYPTTHSLPLPLSPSHRLTQTSPTPTRPPRSRRDVPSESTLTEGSSSTSFWI